jgi:glycosyltransferase involved in cell wall biosynthesis
MNKWGVKWHKEVEKNQQWEAETHKLPELQIKRILMIAPTPFFADRGCHIRIYGEICGLQKLGYEILLCTYGLGADMPGVKTVRTFNFPWYRKLTAGPSITKIFLLPLLVITTFKQIKKFRPGIVHAFLHEGALIAKCCSFWHKSPQYFFDMQGSLTGELLQHKFIKRDSLIYKLFAFIERRINNFFPIITQSKNLEQQLWDSGIVPQRVTNVLDAANIEWFSPRMPNVQLAARYGIDLNKPRVVFMGLLETYQGVDIMFEAFREVHHQIPDVQFIVIGYPNIEKYRELVASYGLEKRVFFLGKKRYCECPDYLALGQIAVAPKVSLAEGDGKLYDYMAMGLPTVAFDRLISREIMADCGLYAVFKDSFDLAQKILYLLRYRETAELFSKKARQRAVKYLSYNIMAKKISDFYKQFYAGNF